MFRSLLDQALLSCRKSGQLIVIASLCFAVSVQAEEGEEREERDPLMCLDEPESHETKEIARPTREHLHYQRNPLSVFFHMNTTFPLSNMTLHNFDAAELLDTVEAFDAARVIVVVKHGDGFLWYRTSAPRPADKGTPQWNPEGSMRSTRGIAWKDGKGDVLRKIAREARARGIGVGIYYNMVDDSQDVETRGIARGIRVSQDDYNEYVKKSFTDILTNYGKLDELWFDGNVSVGITEIIKPLIEQHQPNAVIFGGTWGQPLIKWSGDEEGTFEYPAWNGNVIDEKRFEELQKLIDAKDYEAKAPGFEYPHEEDSRDKHQLFGNPKGNVWMPIEADVRATENWFGGKPKSVKWLTDMYYNVVGYGGALLVNFPVRHDGTHDPKLVENVEKAGDKIRYAGRALHKKIDFKKGNEWTVQLRRAVRANRLHIKENIARGEQILCAKVEGYNPDEKQWKMLAGFSAIGSYQIRPFEEQLISEIRFKATQTQGGEARIKQLYLTADTPNDTTDTANNVDETPEEEISVDEIADGEYSEEEVPEEGTPVTPVKKTPDKRAVDKTPPSVPKNLYAHAISDTEVDLRWSRSRDKDIYSRVGYYEIYSNGVSLGRSSALRRPLYKRVTGLNENTEYEFKVRAANIFGAKSDFSEKAYATTLRDYISPKVLAAGLVVNNKTVDVLFSESIEQQSAESAANYTISPSVTVTSASLQADKRTVRLSLASELKSLGKYKLTVSLNVKDLAGSPNYLETGGNQVEINTVFGLLRYYNLDEGKGTQINNSGIIGGSSEVKFPRWVKGKVGKGALEFDGTSTYSNLAVDIRPDNSFTLAAWVYPTESCRTHSILTEEKSGKKELQFRFQILNDLSLFFRHSDQGESHYQIRSANGAVPLNKWTHVAVRYDTDKPDYALFVNGAKVQSPTVSDSPTRVTRPDNPAPGLLGAITTRENDGKALHYFKGRMDEVYIYGLPLPDEAIRSLSGNQVASSDTAASEESCESEEEGEE